MTFRGIIPAFAATPNLRRIMAVFNAQVALPIGYSGRVHFR
jgi:hypothetical protein